MVSLYSGANPACLADVVQVGDSVLLQMGISRIQFVQEGYRSPGVGIRLWVSDKQGAMCAIDEKGKLELSPQIADIISDTWQKVLRMCLLADYADLVVPIDDSSNVTCLTNNTVHIGADDLVSYDDRSQPGEHRGKASTDGDRFTYIPRKKRSGGPTKHDSYFAHRITTGTYVDPFRRRLPKGRHVSVMKKIEASLAGVDLRGPGYPEIEYTYVHGFVRGGEGKKPHFRRYPAKDLLAQFLEAIGL